MKIKELENKEIKFEVEDKYGNIEIIDDYYWFEENSFHNNKERSAYCEYKIKSIIIED